MTTLDRIILGFLIGTGATGLSYSLGLGLWPGFWAGLILTTIVTALTLGDRR